MEYKKLTRYTTQNQIKFCIQKIEFSSVACQVEIPLQIVKMDPLQKVLPPHKCTSMQMKFSCSLNQCNFRFLLPSTIGDLFCLKITIFVVHLILLPSDQTANQAFLMAVA